MSDYGSPPPPPPGGGYPPAQGMPMGGAPMGQPPPPNNLVWAILSTIFCCLPLGIVSIVFAAQVNGKWQAGDRAGAMDASRKARTFALWATIVGLLFILGYVVLIAVAISSGNSTSSL